MDEKKSKTSGGGKAESDYHRVIQQLIAASGDTANPFTQKYASAFERQLQEILGPEREYWNLRPLEIRRELYSLLTILLADGRIAELAEKQSEFGDLSEEMLHSTASLKLLTVAVSIRSALAATVNAEPPLYGVSDKCGALVKNIHAKSASKEPLFLYDACSKVVHATRTLFYEETDKPSRSAPVFGERITLYGKWERGKAGKGEEQKPPTIWRAQIVLPDFVAGCLAALKAVQNPVIK